MRLYTSMKWARWVIFFLLLLILAGLGYLTTQADIPSWGMYFGWSAFFALSAVEVAIVSILDDVPELGIGAISCVALAVIAVILCLIGLLGVIAKLP